jgi:hypothetical protein
MQRLRVWALAVMVAIAISVGGCGGGGAQLESQTTTTTLGQELQDLDTAYQKGLLSKEEYDKTRQRIMERYNK